MSKDIRDVFIVNALRTPIGKLRGGLSVIRPDDLLAKAFSALLKSPDVNRPPIKVDEVFAGCANQAGEDNRNVARMAWLLANGSYEVPAITVNRLCASGLDAVIQGMRAIAVGDAETVMVGGVESMSRAPLVVSKGAVGFATGNREMFDTAIGWRFPNPLMAARFPLEGMGQTAENIVDHVGISRLAQDQFAYDSHKKAIAAWEAGHFTAEVFPVDVNQRKHSYRLEKDEGPRENTTLERLAALKPAFREGGSVTAGNSSTLSDGSAALLLCNEATLQRSGYQPLGRIISCAAAGIDPQMMGLGPVESTKKALLKAKLSIQDLDLIELNEAFAAQSLAVIELLDLDINKVNINGGAISLGHPLGCSGARILTTLLHSLKRRKLRYGLATLCVGVGQGVSMVVECV